MRESKIIEYHITVDEIHENGHPIQKIEYSLKLAHAWVDRFRAKYPEGTSVRLFAIEKREITGGTKC